jgi:hypothetical protein
MPILDETSYYINLIDFFLLEFYLLHRFSFIDNYPLVLVTISGDFRLRFPIYLLRCFNLYVIYMKSNISISMYR